MDQNSKTTKFGNGTGKVLNSLSYFLYSWLCVELTILPLILNFAQFQVKRSLMVKLTDNSSYSQSGQLTSLKTCIANFTPLSEKLSAYHLVATLNQLFGKFDQIAQENQCMRIKILGDCYYCVSGLPVSRPNHAINIVRMGLARSAWGYIIRCGHEDWCSYRQCSVWCYWSEEMAIWCQEWWCHHGQYHEIEGCPWVGLV